MLERLYWATVQWLMHWQRGTLPEYRAYQAMLREDARLYCTPARAHEPAVTSAAWTHCHVCGEASPTRRCFDCATSIMS